MRILLLTFPAYGHYMTIRDLGVALAARGHAVTYALCEQSHRSFALDLGGLPNVSLLSAGACASYDLREPALASLIAAPGDLRALGAMLDGVAALGAEMCEVLLQALLGARARGELRDVILFDADSYCGMDLGHALRVPAVARVGTGPRDAYSSPAYVPLYGSGAAAPSGLAERLANRALGLLARRLLAPWLLPRIYSRHRARFVRAADEELAGRRAAGGAEEAPAAPPAGASPGALRDWAARRLGGMRADLLWDGQPTLYNSHWGLEHPRPLQPFEHLVGHTTDFAAEAARALPPEVMAWLEAPGGRPIVYAALGTLSVLPGGWLAGLAAAISAAAGEGGDGDGDGDGAHSPVRFLWVVPAAQQAGLLPAGLAAASAAWHAGARGAPPPVLLVDWLPQVAALRHPAVRAFLTHGGMNSLGEALFARRPMLCAPLFSDQPDNCARVAERGLGVQLALGAAGGAQAPAQLARALAQVLGPAAPAAARARALEAAWRANLAAGGIPRAVALVEAAAAGGYGGHLHALPAHYFAPAHHAADGALLALLLAAAAAALLAALGACLRAGRRRWRGGEGVPEGGQRTEQTRGQERGEEQRGGGQ